MARDWFIGVSHPQKERLAAAHLEDRGFEVWYPTQDVEIFKARHMRKPVFRPYPLFPSYLFLRPKGTRPVYAWQTILGRSVRVHMGEEPHHSGQEDVWGATGMRALICNDHRPVMVGDADVDRLRARLVTIRPEDEPLFDVGDIVWTTKGPLFDMRGVVARGVRKGSVEVLMTMLGRATPVEVPVEQLRRVA